MFDKEAAEKFDRIAKTDYEMVYPVIAGQIVEKTGLNEGLCVDLGSGPGSLAIAVARKTFFSVLSFDLSSSMSAVAMKNIIEAGLSDRVFAVTGNVEVIPFPDDSFDLAVSRGSMFFWKDKTAAFSEINRILRPGGWAYIGGGFGTPELAAAVKSKPGEIKRRREFKGKTEGRKFPPGDHNPESYHKALACAGISDYSLKKDSSGFWITFRKNPE
ncbi:ubiquinone/menaquinone biosynthesis C-methylase UbiE [Methanomicrobium sp. W14]|uniref:class I SAM-dependent methyltransferase n=1 Tax=Methanomicrobium sp. W14 TaxID=2817839 RepID=UPI001AE71C14|nr:class I SAM-dependent methyltransferase [Methanomicrobium sp. W14]MBP2134033.1 ubiquinone/menaquinone biosynthesis C-methylase UbiE [Methanomicrobium sp. W14]